MKRVIKAREIVINVRQEMNKGERIVEFIREKSGIYTREDRNLGESREELRREKRGSKVRKEMN